MSNDKAAELAQAKDDMAKILEAAKIYDARYKGADFKAVLGIIEAKIARLEAEADPHREAKEWIEKCRTASDPSTRRQVALVDHLTAENAEMKHKYDLANATIETATNRLNEVKAENERLTARVLATAVNVLGSIYKKKQSHEVWVVLKDLDHDAKPYKLKGGE